MKTMNSILEGLMQEAAEDFNMRSSEEDLSGNFKSRSTIGRKNEKTPGGVIGVAANGNKENIYKTSSDDSYNMIRNQERDIHKLGMQESELPTLRGPTAGAQAFINAHLVKKTNDANNNGDDVFKALNIKKTKHKPDESLPNDEIDPFVKYCESSVSEEDTGTFDNILDAARYHKQLAEEQDLADVYVEILESFYESIEDEDEKQEFLDIIESDQGVEQLIEMLETQLKEDNNG